jgi:hypothetical protein
MTTVDVGDAFELVFTTATGATVLRSWYDPDDLPVVELEPIAEYPPGSGKYPYVFQATRPGIWTARVTVSGTATAVEEHYVYARPVPAEKPLAVIGQVTEQYGTLTPAQEGLTSALLRTASKLVRSRHPRIDVQIAAGLLDPEVVALVVTNMVLRVLRNPGGLRAETIGPFSKSFDTGDAAGLLTITKDELTMLTPTRSGAGAVAVGSIMMRPGLAPPPTGLSRGW